MGYTFFRGSFDLGDIDHDGIDEMVIGDDEGGYHVYRFTHAGFVPIWINDPIIEDGYIVAVEILHDNVPGIRPQILLLDSDGTLHQIQYNSYFFEETATYPDYRKPDESGRLVVTGIIGGAVGSMGGRSVFIAIPDFAEEEIPPEDTEEIPDPEIPDSEIPEDELDEQGYEWFGMTLYRLTSEGLVELTDSEMAELQDGDVYFIQELNEYDINEIKSLGSDIAGVYPSVGYRSDRVGLADLDSDALLELLVSVGDPDRPIDRLEIYKNEGGEFMVKITLELPLLNEMVLGDVDGDGFTEIVGLTFDGEVLVYQYDPLTVELSDETGIDWDYPHKIIDETIWVSLSGFEKLGCTVVEGEESSEVRYGNLAVTIDRDENILRCGDEVLLDELPNDALEFVPYLPLLSTLECLGFHYTVDPDRDLVVVEIEE